MDYPRMLYKFPGVARDAAKLQDGTYDTLVVENPDEHQAAFDAGWFDTTADARAPHDKAAKEAAANADAAAAEKRLAEARALVAAADDTAPASRDELEQKATELGLKFDGRTTDAKLSAAIDAKLKA